jgi:hypothetical protein
VAQGVVVPFGAVRTANAGATGATGAHADADALRVLAEALVAMWQWTFLLGPGLIPGITPCSSLRHATGRGSSRG